MPSRGKAALHKPKLLSSSDEEELPRRNGKLLARFVSEHDNRGRKAIKSDVSSSEDFLGCHRWKLQLHRPSARKQDLDSTTSSDSDFDLYYRAKQKKHALSSSSQDSCTSCSDPVCRRSMISKRKEAAKLLERHVQTQKNCGRGCSPFNRAVSLDNWYRKKVQYGGVSNKQPKESASAKQGSRQWQQQRHQSDWNSSGSTTPNSEAKLRKQPFLSHQVRDLSQASGRRVCSRHEDPGSVNKVWRSKRCQASGIHPDISNLCLRKSLMPHQDASPRYARIVFYVDLQIWVPWKP